MVVLRSRRPGRAAFRTPCTSAVFIRTRGYPRGIHMVDAGVAGLHDASMGVGTDVRIQLLGSPQVDGSRPLSPRDGRVLGILAVRRGKAVAPAEIADALWGADLPRSWSKQVHICIGRLRKVAGTGAIETAANGYRLAIDPDDVDIGRFERLAQSGRSFMVTAEPVRAAAAFEAALMLWRGHPFEDLEAWDPAVVEAGRLDEERRSVEDGLLDARPRRATMPVSQWRPRLPWPRNPGVSGDGSRWRRRSTGVDVRPMRSARWRVFAAFLSSSWGSIPEPTSWSWRRRSFDMIPPSFHRLWLCRSSTTPALTRAWRRTKSMTPPCFWEDAEVAACVARRSGDLRCRRSPDRRVAASRRSCVRDWRRGSPGAGGAWWCSPLVPIPAPLSVRLSIALASTQTPPERLWSISSRSCSPPSSQPPRPPRSVVISSRWPRRPR